jgi:hypothetical protein
MAAPPAQRTSRDVLYLDLDKLQDPVWEPQPGESMVWFLRFAKYRDIGVTRSIQKAYEVDTGIKMKAHQPVRGWFECARRYLWADRALAWDLDNYMRARQVALDAKREILELSSTAVGVLRDAMSPETKMFYRLQAAIQVFDRAGIVPPPNQLEISGPNGGPVQVAQELTDEQLATIAAAGHTVAGKFRDVTPESNRLGSGDGVTSEETGSE